MDRHDKHWKTDRQTDMTNKTLRQTDMINNVRQIDRHDKHIMRQTDKQQRDKHCETDRQK